MLQLGRDPDLAEKPVGPDGGSELRTKHLDRHRPVVPGVPGQVHRGHASLTDQPLDGVATVECGTERVERIGHRRCLRAGRDVPTIRGKSGGRLYRAGGQHLPHLQADRQRSPGLLAMAFAMPAASSAGVSLPQGSHVRGRLGQMELKYHRLIAMHERRLSCKALEQHAAHRIEVAPVVDVGQGRDLLRAHVGGGPDRYPGPGELVGSRGDDRPGNAEVQQHRPLTGEHDIGGLHIAVDDPVAVGVIQSVQQVTGDSQRLGDRQARWVSIRSRRVAPSTKLMT